MKNRIKRQITTSGRAQADTARFNDRESPGQAWQYAPLLEERFNQPKDERGGSVPWHLEHGDAGIGGGRVVADVREAKIAGQQARVVVLRVAGNGRIFGVSQADISHVKRFMPVLFQQGLDGTRQVGINQETHGQRSGGQRMVDLLLDQFFGVADGCANVFWSQVVLPANLVETHAAGEAAENASDRHPCASNHRFAVLNFRVNDDPLVHDLNLTFGEHPGKQFLRGTAALDLNLYRTWIKEGSWVDWLAFTYNGPIGFMDLGAPATQRRFYRAVSP